MKISLIVAVAENGVIGKDNKLPWHLPADMKYFRDTTMGHCVIMGRKNYDSIPLKYRPLEGRTNIVVTMQKDFKAEGCIVVNSIEEALMEAKTPSNSPEGGEQGGVISPLWGQQQVASAAQGGLEVFVIGGADIYKQTIDMADKLYVTHIRHTFDGDAFFPKIDESKWKLISQMAMKPDEKNKFPFSFCEYERIEK